MKMDEAIAYYHQQPKMSISGVAAAKKVNKSTLAGRLNGSHAPRGVKAKRNFSVVQEGVLEDKINEYADRGTLLQPRHVKELAERLWGHQVGVNWTSTFLRRHKDKVTSRFYRIQDTARLKADTPEHRQAFYHYVSGVYDRQRPKSINIYNMDETGFPVSTDHCSRRVGRASSSRKSQAALADDVRITVIATVSTTDAPIPPYRIYPGQTMLEEWVNLRDNTTKQIARSTDSGYTNNSVHIDWLERCFDPYSKPRAAGLIRLLFLDGHNAHVTIDFLDCCYEKGIIAVIFPAHMSGIYQPLDVDFFGPLKSRYSSIVSDYQLGSSANRASKGMFYQWHQRAWAQTATSRQCREAWAKTGLFPLDRAQMLAESPLPEPTAAQSAERITPHSRQALRELNALVRRHQASPTGAFMKTAKGMEKVLAEKVLLEDDLARRTASDELDRAARGGNERTRYPEGFVFGQEWYETHPEELAEKRAAEQKRIAERRAADRKQRGKRRALDIVEQEGGPSGEQES